MNTANFVMIFFSEVTIYMDRKHKGHKRELLPAVVYFGYDRGSGVITCCLTRVTNFYNLLFKVLTRV